MPSRPSKGLLRTVLVALALTPLALVVPTSAHADTATRLASAKAQLRALEERAERVAEQLDAERIRLADASKKATAARKRAAAASSDLTGLQATMDALVARAYRSGGDATALLTPGGPQEFLDRAATLDLMARSQADAVAGLSAARHRAAQAVMDTKAALAAEQASMRKISAAKASIVADANRMARLVHGLQAQKIREAAAVFVAQSDYSPPVNAVVANGSAASIAVQWAYNELGKPYVWGASGPNSFDCSGLTMYVYGKAGISLPHYTGAQYNSGRHVSRSELRPGDLIFYYSDLHHVAIYIGGGRVIHAPHSGDVVKISNMDMDPYAGAVRVAG